jgi:hypothetical protein
LIVAWVAANRFDEDVLNSICIVFLLESFCSVCIYLNF